MVLIIVTAPRTHNINVQNKPPKSFEMELQTSDKKVEEKKTEKKPEEKKAEESKQVFKVI